MSKEVRATLVIPGKAPDEIWPLLAQGAQLEQWFCEAAAVDLAQARFDFWGRYTPDTPGPGAGHVSSVAAAPPDGNGNGGRLSFAWQLRGQPTRVELSLHAAGDGTELKLHHSALGERLNQKGALHDFWYSALENLRLYALTGRPQQFVEYGALAGTSMTVEVEIAAPPERVFQLLIEPAQMARLWDDERIAVEPRVGGVYDYGWKEGGPRRILALDPPRLLSFSWLYPPETEESTVTWRLAAIDGGTRLSLTHEGFIAGADHEEYRAGWFSFLAIIKGISELESRWTRVRMQGSAHGEA